MAGHQSVLLNESIEALNIAADGIYVDGTFGRGGHSQAILDRLGPNGRLIAVDKDIKAIEWGTSHFGSDKRFSIHHCSFADLGHLAADLNMKEKVNGILLDLGVSSPQLDEAERGFSFMQDGPLDMRMDERAALDAHRFVNQSSVELMIKVFKEYGEEKFARRIAFAIEKARSEKPITRTLELAEIVKAANPKWEKHKHPATRVFQAIRIYINAELSDLQTLLTKAYEILAINGRLAVISFHSLEDRIVKNFFRNETRGAMIPVEIPVKGDALDIRFKKIGKAIKPSEEEIKHNVRARSAVLRVGEKLA